jgi:catalase-peroxidase
MRIIQTKKLVSAVVLAVSPLLMPVASAQEMTRDNDYWWPNRVDLEPLRMNELQSGPLSAEFDYVAAFNNLDIDALKADLVSLMTTSQDWWPADYGHYGPFFIRMAWHSAGTYRTSDGRGGSDGGFLRFAPLNSWPDNANLDKAVRLLQPIKQKYGNNISWADLIVLAGTVAMESMGFETFGFAGGRIDSWVANNTDWGSEAQWLEDNRHSGNRDLKRPLGATQMGLIYVNPEGPNGTPDPLAAAHDIRETFGRMAMNDEETAALIAGGHTFGKAHGAAKASECVGVEPEAGQVEDQALGWKNNCETGKGVDTITSGLEGAWTVNPTQWTHNYLQNLYGYDWVMSKSPGGATQWVPSDGAASNLVPDAHDPSKRHAPIMFTTDLSLREDPGYREVTSRWLENPEEFSAAFGRAWFKLTHRDLGPSTRYLGSLAPNEQMIWQDPIPAVDYTLIDESDANAIKVTILDSGLSVGDLVRTAWAGAVTYRNTDMRGGINGARLALAPQKDWSVNDPTELDRVLSVLKRIQEDFNDKATGRKKVSLADLIVLAGNAGVEAAAAAAGHDIEVPFIAGRNDTSQELTDVSSFAVLEPTSDGFRNYHDDNSLHGPVDSLVDKASVLGLTSSEMTALVGGMRVMDANYGSSKAGVLTATPGVLNNHFFVNLVDMSTEWSNTGNGIYEGKDRSTGDLKWTATPVDLIFGSNTELRAITEFYAQNDSEEKFLDDFVSAWTKVMEADRFDLHR